MSSQASELLRMVCDCIAVVEGVKAGDGLAESHVAAIELETGMSAGINAEWVVRADTAQELARRLAEEGVPAEDILRAVGEEFADLGEAVAPLVNETIDAAYIGERTRVATDAGIRATLNTVDEAAQAWLKEDTLFWIGSAWDRELGGTIADAARVAGIEQGLGFRETGLAIAEALGEVAGDRGEAYWDVVANAAVQRARSFGSVESFVQAGVVEVGYANPEDEATCFEASTPVTMADGRTKPIVDVRPGEMVLSVRGEPRRVVATRVAPARRWRSIDFVGGGTLKVTPGHPFLSSDGWIPAGLLEDGDQVVRQKGTDLRSLWEAAEPSAGVGLLERLPVQKEAQAVALGGLRILREAVSEEARDSEVLQRRVLPIVLCSGDGSARVRALREAVQSAEVSSQTGPAQVLQRTVLERFVRRQANEGAEVRAVRDVVSGSSDASERQVLLGRVQKGSGLGGLRGVRNQLQCEEEQTENSSVLFKKLLPTAHGRDNNRGRCPAGTNRGRDRIRTGSSGGPLVGGLPRGRGSSGRGGRDLLALAPRGSGTGRPPGREDGGDGLRSNPPGRAADTEGPRSCSARARELWPRPIERPTAAWATVAVVADVVGPPIPAYDLQIEHDRGYIAGGLVVHNSDICEHMVTVVQRVEAVVNTRDRMMAAETPKEAQEIAPWLPPKVIVGASAPDLEQLGVTLPPFHGNCRTQPIILN